MANKKPPKIFTLDTETIGLDGPLKRIAIYDGETIAFGQCFGDVKWILEKWFDAGAMPHVYIHNADFDLRKIPEIFERGNVVWARTKKIGTKYAKVVCKNYVIHDSFKLLPFSLDKLSKDFGLEHGKLDLWEQIQQRCPGEYTDKVDFFNRCPANDPLYVEYLGYDVVSLYELIYKLIDVSGISEEDIVGCLSTASMSKYVMKNGYKGQPFGDPEKTDYQILTSCPAWSSPKKMKGGEISYQECELRIRQGFYGGRTEVFTPVLYGKTDPDGKKLITGYHYDVNSLYPSVMIDNEYPVGYPEFESDPAIIEMNWGKWMRRHIGLGFIECVVFVPKQKIPPLPAKMGKLSFVTGFIKGMWTYHELEYAVKNCGVQITEFISQIHFKKTHKVFHNFVATFFEMKAEGKRTGNSSLTAFAKLMLNTAYGWTVLRRDDKTALRDIKQLDKYKDTDKFILSNEELGYLEIMDTVFSDSIQCQIGAYVTSYARLVLLEALRHQAELGEVYYCDTDSIVCEYPMPDSMIDPIALGKWDCEAKLYSGLFLQPKVYTEEKEAAADTIKFKGVSKAVQQELDRGIYEDIFHLLEQGSDERYLIEKGRKTLPSLSVAQKRGIDPNTFKTMDKTIDLGAVGKRDFDYKNNISIAWHMDTIEAFEGFRFERDSNPPTAKNLYGG